VATARDVITASLQELGVLAAGEVATAAEANDGLTLLNRWLDSKAAERLQIYTVTRSTWTIVSGLGSYTVGTGSATDRVSIARPVFVNKIQFVDTSMDPDLEMPLTLLTDSTYAAIGMKTFTSKYPQAAYYNPTYPHARITFWPVPTSDTLLGVIYHATAVTQLPTLDTAISMPPGYELMLVKNLAVQLAPSYERQVNSLLLEQAREAVAIVKRANKRLDDLVIDRAALVQGNRWGFYNIYSDS
jgi:hypothetical protein